MAMRTDEGSQSHPNLAFRTRLIVRVMPLNQCVVKRKTFACIVVGKRKLSQVLIKGWGIGRRMEGNATSSEIVALTDSSFVGFSTYVSAIELVPRAIPVIPTVRSRRTLSSEIG